MTDPAATAERSAWPQFWALVLCVLTFPLLWVGGLVTTTDAGMAVPDWPNTYGYNLFAYPWRTWLFGPWDLFIEHGHRLLASLVGLITICLLAAVVVGDRRRWMIWLSVAALALVIFQGVLGGVRVIANERLIAMAHGCTGPAFFALACSLVALTSRRSPGDSSPKFARLTGFTALLAYGQLALGASLRHIDALASPWTFAALVKLHLVMAAVVLTHTLLIAWKGARSGGVGGRIGPLLGLIVLTQVSLGVGAWYAKYGAPGWAAAFLPANMGANIAGGWGQTHTVTAHSATGSLLLGLLVLLATRAWLAASTEAGRSA